MFANALRRLAQASSRQLARPVPQFVLPTRLSRSLSTFHALRQGDYDGAGSRYASEGASFRREVPPSTTLFVGNLPYSIEEGELREKFADFGEIKNIRIGMTSDGRARGFGHVEFAELGDAVGALQAIRDEPLHILDRAIRVDFAPPRVESAAQPNRKLYLFDFDGDEHALRAAFKDFESSIVGVHLMKNPQTGESLGAGFVEFMSVDRATEALTSMNGTEIAYGHKLKLAYARPPRPRESRGGARGGRSPEYGHSSSRSSYGGDWGGGQRGSDYRSGGRGGDRGGGGRDRRGGGRDYGADSRY